MDFIGNVFDSSDLVISLPPLPASASVEEGEGGGLKVGVVQTVPQQAPEIVMFK